MSKNYQLDMTKGSIFWVLLKFSIPLICSSILQLLFNAADVIVVGQFAGDESLAAVGATTAIINLLVNLFIGLSVGTTVIAANFFGSNRNEELSQTVHTAILISVIGGIILSIVGVVFSKQILQITKTPKEILDLATVYLKVYFAGILPTVVYNFGCALLRAKGDTKRPLYVLLFSGFINVILNLIFVIVFNMNVAGVALATVISQIIASIFIIKFLIDENSSFKLIFSKLKINLQIFIKIIKIGVPAGFQGIIFSLSNVIIQSAINSFGANVIAGNSAASNLEGFVYIAMNSFAQGALTFVSQNLGAQKYDRIKKSVGISLGCILVIGLILGNVIVLFGNNLLRLYSENPIVIDFGMNRLRLICSLFVLCGLMDVMGNIIRGLGHSFLPMIITLIGACGIRILWIKTIFEVSKFHTCETIYISYPISWIATFIALFISFLFIIKKWELQKNNEII